MNDLRHLSRRVTWLCVGSMAALIGLDLWRAWREAARMSERRERFEAAQAEAGASRKRIEEALGALLKRP